jgi:hypothetical protein
MPDFAIQGRIEKLEVARGYDGLLRRAISPVLVFGAYVTNGSRMRLLGRSVHRFRPRNEYPTEAVALDPVLPSSAVQTNDAFTFVGLACALEEDGGTDIQRMYGALERHDTLSVWRPREPDVEPVALAHLGDAWRAPSVVELSLDGTTAASTCKSDKWIGAVCWTMLPRAGSPTSLYRLPFHAADGRNDWTAVVAIAH